MTSQERKKLSLNHQEPDRVPFDLGGIVSGITRIAHQNLLKTLGYDVPSEEIIIDRIQQLVLPDHRILENFKIDTRYAYMEVPQHIWKKDAPNSIWIDEWGITRRFTGLYFDMMNHPLAQVESLTDLQKFSWPDPHLNQEIYNDLQSQVQIIRQSGKAVIVNVIGSCFEFSWYLRGFEHLLVVSSISCLNSRLGNLKSFSIG